MQPNEKKIWFPAKKYGWGWGPPVCWQGWLVMGLYVLLMVGGALLLQKQIGLMIGYVVVLSIAFGLVCWLKGEEPRWRWGGK